MCAHADQFLTDRQWGCSRKIDTQTSDDYDVGRRASVEEKSPGRRLYIVSSSIPSTDSPVRCSRIRHTHTQSPDLLRLRNPLNHSILHSDTVSACAPRSPTLWGQFGEGHACRKHPILRPLSNPIQPTKHLGESIRWNVVRGPREHAENSATSRPDTVAAPDCWAAAAAAGCRLQHKLGH